MFKKFISLLLSVIFSISLLTNVLADDTGFMTLEEFNSLKQEGYIGDDVSYEALKEIYVESKELENYLENSDLFYEVPFSTDYLYRGDILITNGTTSYGFTGHAAIALNAYEILHIQGPGYKPSVVSPEWFEGEYLEDRNDWIKVYRSRDNIGRLAAQWAEKTYRDSGASYKITFDLSTTHETYCSKLVWQAYYYGVGKEVMPPALQTTSNLISPYGLMEGFNDGSYTFDYLGEL